MDSKSDDHEPDIPSGDSRRELEDALKWLEEITARQGGGQRPAQPPTSPQESPFHGLIESDEGDLPDWLLEAPSATAGVEEVEVESRLDWLAKMAQRESIEELPTLEWRHLSDPVQNAIAPGRAAEWPSELETVPPDVAEVAPPEVAEADSQAVTVNATEPAEEHPASFSQPEQTIPELEPTVAAVEPVAPAIEMAPEEAMLAAATEPPLKNQAVGESPLANDLDAAMAWIEELAASQDAPIEDVPSVADRALASKLMLEAGLTPETLDSGGNWPLPDLSLLEGKTPTNPFVEAEDFADTIVLVETMAADQGVAPQLPAADAPGSARAYEQPAVEATEPTESFDNAMAFLDELAAEQSGGDVDDTQPLPELVNEVNTAIASATAATAAELVAAGEAEAKVASVAAEVDALGEPEWTAVSEEPTPALSETEEASERAESWLLGAAVINTTLADDGEDKAPAEAPEPVDQTTAHMTEDYQSETWPAPPEPEAPVLVAAGAAAWTNGDSHPADAVEERLRALDAIALPPGRTLAEIDASLRSSGAVTRRDLTGALAWLDTVLRSRGPQPAEDLADEDLIARMPEDPDAVLAWLEQMAADEPATAPPVPSTSIAPVASASELEHSSATSSVPVAEITEADLLNMPEDPDEVMAWLEGLAGGAAASATAAVITTAAADEPTPPLPLPAVAEPVTAPQGRSRRRRGRGRQVKTTPAEAEVGEETGELRSADEPEPDELLVASLPAEVGMDVAVDVEIPALLELGEPEEDLIAQAPPASPEEPIVAEFLVAEPPAEVDSPIAVVELPMDSAPVEAEPLANVAPIPLLPPKARRRMRKQTAPAPVEPALTEPAAGTDAPVDAKPEAGTDEPPTSGPEPAPPPVAWVDLLKPLK